MSAPTPPPDKSADRRAVEVLVQALLASVPVVGGLLSAGAQHGLAAGQERLVRQFLTELAEAQDRFLTRLSHVELDAFLARREAAAAINQATQIALRTPSREKHRMLGQAVLNAATRDDEDSLVALFWSLIDRHSALEVKLLAALDDPLNAAQDAGGAGYVRDAVRLDGGPVLGELLSIAVPDLRHDYVLFGQEDERKCPGQWVPDATDDGDEDDDAFDDYDVSGPPDPAWLFQHLLERLAADGLLDTVRDNGGTGADLLLDPSSGILEATMHGLDDPLASPVDETGRYLDRGWSYVSHLGWRYLAFLTAEPVWPPTRGTS